jgi:homeobox protein cut-like
MALREELRLKDDEIAEVRRSLQASMERLEQERDLLSSDVSNLEVRLAAAPPLALVESMKRELRVLKRLEYNAEDGDHEPEMTGVTQDDDLESVLVAKLRRVESELVRERNYKVELSKECDQLRNDLMQAQISRAETEVLVASLEADLQRAISTQSATISQRKVAPFIVRVPNPVDLEHVLDPETPLPPLPPPQDTPSAAEKVDDEHSVATIVMAQRDRLRARCESLESERDAFKRELQGQVQASESLKSDNTKLYEKVRYLQNFNQAASRGIGSNRKGADERDLDLEALEQRYEASVDPFRQFGRTERQRKMKEMSPMERIVFIVAKTVLASKEMRTALFFYVIGMHILVFSTTYHWSDSSCDNTEHHEMLSHLSPDHHRHIVDVISAVAPVVGDMTSQTAGDSVGV